MNAGSLRILRASRCPQLRSLGAANCAPLVKPDDPRMFAQIRHIDANCSEALTEEELWTVVRHTWIPVLGVQAVPAESSGGKQSLIFGGCGLGTKVKGEVPS